MKRLQISSENAEFQVINALKKNRKKRRKSGEIFIEGIESIKQARKANIKFTRIITTDIDNLSTWASSLIRQHRAAKIIEMSDSLYAKLCDREQPSEIIVTAKMRPFDLWEIGVSEKPCVLIFDRPSNYGNFGTIIRSANAFNVDAVFILGHGIDAYDPKVIRSSLGGIFHTKVLNIASTAELKRWLTTQKQRNQLQVVGTDSTGSISLKNKTLKRPIALILGNEAKGMSVALQVMCDYTIRIPLSGAVNSLNVSCAGSILLWEIYRNSTYFEKKYEV